MTIKPEKLRFPPLHCSQDSDLGDYYQDFRGAITLLESGYHGSLDERGVPLIFYRGQGLVPNPIHTAQYALANITAVLAGDRSRAARLQALLDWLLDTQETAGELAGCWAITHDNRKYPWLRAPWTSALASGQAISALLRGWQLLGDERYLRAAGAAYEALHRERPGMTLYWEDGGELWYEEYPGEPPLHVLNGHVYALLGVLDQARVTGDPQAQERWRRAADTVLARLDEFDLGYWSAYDLRSREPVSLHYQLNVHVPLLRILAALTGARRFEATADRWDRYARSISARLRWQVMLRAQRWRRPAPQVRPEVLPQSNGASSISPRIEGVRDATSGHQPVELRPFPYPYRCGLAIANDADLLTPESFRRLNRFLSTREETEWGEGLGLNLGGSFFMFRSPDSPNALTAFDHLTDTVTDDGEEILDAARRGGLDVLHTYGCFTDPNHFNRVMAERAIETLENHRVTIRTWVNHGPPSNIQCLGPREHWQGDAPGTPGYHADLTVDYGIRWLWTGLRVSDDFVSDGNEDTDGHGRIKRFAKAARATSTAQLIEPHTLRDGNQLHTFQRYGGLAGRTPVLDDLPIQLAAHNLDLLAAQAGYAIVYQHLAVRRVTSGFGPRAYGPVGEEWFSRDELAALRELARRHHSGEIWVVPTTKLLDHRKLTQELAWTVRRGDEVDEIVIVAGAESPGELAGISLYCDRPDQIAVQLQGRDSQTPIASLRPNPPDHTGRSSLTLLPSTEV